MAESMPPPQDRELVDALAELGRTIQSTPTADLSAAVHARVLTLGPPPPPSWLDRLRGHLGQIGLVVVATTALAGFLVFGPGQPAEPVPEPRLVMVLGGDLTDLEQEEVVERLSAETPAMTVAMERVSRQEMQDVLQSVGIPPEPGDAAISSVAIECNAPDNDTIRVHTERVTRLNARDYAVVLLIVGVQQGAASIVAPESHPVTGETAMVGLLRGVASCQTEGALNEERVRLAYEYLALTLRLAEEGNGFGPASDFMTVAIQQAIGQPSANEAELTTRVNDAALTAGVSFDAERSKIVALFQKLAELDYGSFGSGVQIEQPGPDEVIMTPPGAISSVNDQRRGEVGPNRSSSN